MSAASCLDGLISMMFVPAGNEKLIRSAVKRDMRMVILDLEDAIPPSGKDAARAGLKNDVDILRSGSSKVCVRVNRPWTLMMRDLEAVVAAGSDFVMVPKMESRDEITVVAQILDELCPAQTLPVISQIETARGLLAMGDIAKVRPDRQAALMLGPEDLALDLGVVPSPETMTAHARALITAARAGGLAAIGSPGSIAEITDMALYRSQIEAGKAMGFTAVGAIHPRQVDVIEDVYRPDPEEIAAAQRLVAENDAHGGRPFMLEGRMIDAPVVDRARRLIASASK